MKRKLLYFIPMLFAFFSMGIVNAQTGYTDDCTSIQGWDQSHSSINVLQAGEIITLEYNTTQKWTGIHYGLGQSIDISSAPYIELDIRPVDQPCILNLYLFDSAGGHQYPVRINPSDDFVTILTDFSGSGLNLTEIEGMLFTANGASLGYTGDLEIDEIRLGTNCQQVANIGGTTNKVYYKNSGNHSFALTDIENASSITLSSSSLIENVNVSPISNGKVDVDFDISADQTGTETLTLTAIGTNGFSDNTYTFDLTVEDNSAPTLLPVDNMDVPTGASREFVISGISDGVSTAEQHLTVDASSDNLNATGAFLVDYNQGERDARISFTPSEAATNVQVTITVSDGELSTDETFSLNIFDDYNYAPVIDKKSSQSVMTGSGEQSIALTGIGDGDNSNQNLTITAVSSDETIVSNSDITVNYTQGETTAELLYMPGAVGKTEITVSVTDDGDSGSNNGNQTSEMTFVLEIIPQPLTGYTVPLDDWESDLENNIWKVEGAGGVQELSYEEFEGEMCAKIVVNDKTCWTGLWYRTPSLNISDNPAISFDMYITNTTEDVQTHGYFWDNVGNRNIAGAHAERTTVSPNQWTNVMFDFRADGFMETDEGVPVNADRVDSILLNYHPAFGDPSTVPKWSGTIYIKNIKWGDHVDLPVLPVQCTIDEVPDMSEVVSATPSPIEYTLTGLSDGEGNTNNLNVSVSSSNTATVSAEIGSVTTNGTADITLTPGTSVGNATVTVTVSTGGASEDNSTSFEFDLTPDDPAQAVNLEVNLNTTHQTIHGFGTYMFPGRSAYSNMYAKDLGASAMRVGLISNQIEPVNDNSDPYVLDMNKLNYNAFDWDYLRNLKENGVETFILTSWSPPAWMKDNFAKSYFMAGVSTDNDASSTGGNMLSYHYYQEFAESMVAAYRMFEQELGIQLKGIGLQNEPAFHEPYPSAILDVPRFVELIKVVGERFELEGIDCELFMPEQVFSQNSNSMTQYINGVVNDPDADNYCRVIATHGYADDGVGEGTPDYSAWQNMYDQAQQGSNAKELWMTETWPQYASWESAIKFAGALHGGLVAGNVSLWTTWGIEDQLIIRGKPTGSFYTYKNFTKFIKPGAVRVGATSAHEDILVSAAVNEAIDGGNLSVVLINKGNAAVSVDLDVLGTSIPSEYEVYLTSQNRNFKKVSTIAQGDIISIPAMSVTTVLGIGETHQLTVNGGEGSGAYGVSSEVTITANDPAAGERFKAWTGDIEHLVDANSKTTTVTMPAQDISVTATYEPITAFDLVFNVGDGQDPIEGATINSDLGTITTDASGAATYSDLEVAGTYDFTISADGFDEETLQVDVDGEKTVNVTLSTTTGINEISSGALGIFPNPASEYLNVLVPEASAQEILVTNFAGTVVLQQKVESGMDNFPINISDLKSGVYILKVKTENGELSKKFLVK